MGFGVSLEVRCLDVGVFDILFAAGMLKLSVEPYGGGVPHTAQCGSRLSLRMRMSKLRASKSISRPHSVSPRLSKTLMASKACKTPMLPTTGARMPFWVQVSCSLSSVSG